MTFQVDDWKNYWNDGSGLHGLTVGGHYFDGSMRNLGDFSSQDCTLERKDHYSALKRPRSSVQESVGELDVGTCFDEDIYEANYLEL